MESTARFSSCNMVAKWQKCVTEHGFLCSTASSYSSSFIPSISFKIQSRHPTVLTMALAVGARKLDVGVFRSPATGLVLARLKTSKDISDPSSYFMLFQRSSGEWRERSKELIMAIRIFPI